jgi:hypothetical protein
MANIGPTFAHMLPADSEFVMPTSDKDVQAALVSFGAVFKTTVTFRSVPSCSSVWRCFTRITSTSNRSLRRCQ